MKLDSSSVILVTGASRGVGKGIALALAASGATIYITGRSVDKASGNLPGTIHQTTQEINQRGGKGIAVACDHSDDTQIDALFERINTDHGGVDLLVNNVFKVPDCLLEEVPFWKKPKSYWGDIIDIGLRAHYLASCHAAEKMVAKKSGLIVNISSFGARCFIHTPIYGIGKAGADKMAHDMAVELRPHKVAALSLWLGIVRTERTQLVMSETPQSYEALSSGIESPEFAGRIIQALANDPQLMDRSGKSWISAQLGEEYGVVDIDGKKPSSYAAMLGEPATPSEAVIR